MSEFSPYKVYKLTCALNQKIYIGITKRPLSKRMSQHRKLARSGSSFLISRAIKKHGWENFKVDLLAESLTQSEAHDMEIALIKQFGACYENGYNMTPGGQLGVSLRPETAVRRSESGKRAWENSEKMQRVVKDPERNRKIGEHSKILHRDPEYRERFLARHSDMVEASKDPECRKRAKETFKNNGHCTAVICSNGLIFESLAEASDWVCGYRGGSSKSKRPNILACAKGKRNKAYGYNWVLA